MKSEDTDRCAGKGGEKVSRAELRFGPVINKKPARRFDIARELDFHTMIKRTFGPSRDDL